MLKIGLTGGIGSGKSTIAKVFSTLGIPIYDADSAAKRLMISNEVIKQKLIAHFGEATYLNGELNRNYLSSIVFQDEQKLKQLNAITHPITITDSQSWFAQQNASYAIKEAALIFESHSETYLDYVIGVWAPVQLRVERTLLRGGITEQQVRTRMSNQMDENKKMELCHFVIDNSGQQSALEQVLAIHQKLQTLANQ